MTAGYWTACRCLLPLLATLAACGNRSGSSGDEARLEALERQAETLSQRIEQGRPELDPVIAATQFDIECPAPWQPLGAAGAAAWTCRANQPSPSGLWSNCNVTVGAADPQTNPKQYFDQSLASVPQLKAAQRLSDRTTTLGASQAHEALYEHHLLGERVPLRVLATVGVIGERVYAVSCSAAPEVFATHEALFRRVIRSFQPKP